MPIRIDLFDIGGLLHGDVVRDDELKVFGEHHVLFDVVGTLSMRQDLGPFGVFDDVSARTAMGDENWRRGSCRSFEIGIGNAALLRKGLHKHAEHKHVE